MHPPETYCAFFKNPSLHQNHMALDPFVLGTMILILALPTMQRKGADANGLSWHIWSVPMDTSS